MGQCPIWQTAASVEELGDVMRVNSPRAGGCYAIVGTVRAILSQMHDADRRAIRPKLTTWLQDQLRAGIDCPVINSTVLDRVRQQAPIGFSERVERFFQMLNEDRFPLSGHIRIAGQVDETAKAATAKIAARIEADEDKDVGAFLRILEQMGLLKQEGNHKYFLTAQGFQRLDMARQGGAVSNQAFVAMWFNPVMDAVYEVGIAPAIADAGYTPFRVDQKEHNNKIDDEIIAEIRRSRFLVADFTCGTLEVDGIVHADARGGVYYEAGFAQGLGMPVIWTVRHDCLPHVHFDVRQFAQIVWTDAADLRFQLLNRIRATIT